MSFFRDGAIGGEWVNVVAQVSAMDVHVVANKISAGPRSGAELVLAV